MREQSLRMTYPLPICPCNWNSVESDSSHCQSSIACCLSVTLFATAKLNPTVDLTRVYKQCSSARTIWRKELFRVATRRTPKVSQSEFRRWLSAENSLC